MRIREFHVGRYGPLAYGKPVTLGPLNVLYGDNERGKSLTIDAIVKLLVGRGLKPFARIDRVDQSPEGYLLLSDEGENALKVPESGRYTDLAGLTPAECANTFIVRNSDLGIADESDFYTGLSERLTGLRMRAVGEIRSTLEDMAHVTPKWAFRDREGEKVKTLLDESGRMTEEIDRAIERMRERDFDSLYERVILLREKIEGIDRELAKLERARRRDRHRRSMEALEGLRASRREMATLDGFTEEGLGEWRAMEDRLREEGERARDIEERIEREEKEARALEREYEEEGQTLRIAEERKRRIEEGAVPLLQTCDMLLQDLHSRRSVDRFLTVVFILLTGLGLLSLAGAVMRAPSLLFGALAGAFLLGSLVAGILKLGFLKKRGRYDAAIARLSSLLAPFGLQARDLHEAKRSVQLAHDEHATALERVRSLEGRRNTLQGKLSSLREQRAKVVLDSVRRRIEEIRAGCDAGSLEEYDGQMSRKRALRDSAERDRHYLTREHGEPGPDGDEDPLDYWTRSVAALRRPGEDDPEGAEDAPRVSFEEGRVDDLRAERGDITSQLEEREGEVREFREILDQIERKYNELSGDEYAYCSSTSDLVEMKNRLKARMSRYEDTRRIARLTLDIFEEIEREERKKITDLFGEGNPVSKVFRGITGGAYREVVLDPDTSRIGIRRAGGAIVDVDKLSSGTFDQLYFAIRLALAGELLHGGTGFFIMDDPFIRSDPGRLRKQFDILIDVSSRGWQVLYFTAKGEVKTLAEEHAKDSSSGIKVISIDQRAKVEV